MLYTTFRRLTLNLPRRYGNQFRTITAALTSDEATNEHSDSDKSKTSEKDWNDFTREFMEHRIEVTPFQRIILGVGSSIAALVDPRRHDMIACLGETTGVYALQQILHSMRATDEGQRILKQKPRINTQAINLDRLRNLTDNTFGRAYVKFLDDNQVTPDSRMVVRFMDDPELAYVMTRYRECHDLVHTILGMPTNMLGEVAVKWVEALNNGLPMCYGGAVFGAFRLRPKQRQRYLSEYLPWAIQNGKSAKPMMAVYWEERWEQDIDEMRKELQITTLKLN